MKQQPFLTLRESEYTTEREREMSNRTKTPFRRHRQSDSSAYPAHTPVVGDRSREGGRKEAALVVMVAAAGLVALGSLATLNGAANRGGFGGGVVAEPSHRSNVGRRLLDDAARPGRRRIGGARFDRVVYPPNNNGDGKERGTLRQLLADDYETGVGEGDAAQVSAEEETEEDVQREIAEEKEEEREIAEEAREERAQAREERRERREQRQEMREAVEEVKEEVAEEQEEEAEAEAEAEAEEAKEEQEEEAAEARDSAEENEREEEEREEEQAAAVEEE